MFHWLLQSGSGMFPKGSYVEGLVPNVVMFRGGPLEKNWIMKTLSSSTDSSMDGSIGEWTTGKW